jgi:hypothetical protein
MKVATNMSKLLDRVKSIAKTVNAGLMETYVPRSQAEMDFYNTHTIIKYKNLVPGVTDDDKVFNASNITKGLGHTGRSKDNTDPTDDKPSTNDKSSKTAALEPKPIQNDD